MTLLNLCLLNFTDFSASLDLGAAEKDNSVDRHAVLAIIVVLHSKRAVTVNKDGKMVEHLVYECDIYLDNPCRKARRTITFSITHA
jgi:hypothetical protein